MYDNHPKVKFDLPPNITKRKTWWLIDSNLALEGVLLLLLWLLIRLLGVLLLLSKVVDNIVV